MDPQDAYTKFAEKMSSSDKGPVLAIAFFVGYAYGATGARENIDALVAAFKETQTGEKP